MEKNIGNKRITNVPLFISVKNRKIIDKKEIAKNV